MLRSFLLRQRPTLNSFINRKASACGARGGQIEWENRANIFDPKKWLGILQRWRPRERREVSKTSLSPSSNFGPITWRAPRRSICPHGPTTRSGREKFDRLGRWRDGMRSDPLFWPHLVERDRPVSIMVKKIVDELSRPVTRFDVERKFRRFCEVPSTGLAQELKELANRAEIDRLAAGLFWRKGKATAPYELDAQRAYKLVHSAADQRMREAELAAALGLSRRDTAPVVSQLRKRGLFSSATGKGFVVASAESRAMLQRGPIFDGRGGIFFTAPERPAPLDAAVFTALRAERPGVEVPAQADSAERLSRSAQRHLRKERAPERWREEATSLMEQYPERSPKPLPELFKYLRIDGLTRQIFKNVICEVAAALLREKGLKTSWTEPGAPPRG